MFSRISNRLITNSTRQFSTVSKQVLPQTSKSSVLLYSIVGASLATVGSYCIYNNYHSITNFTPSSVLGSVHADAPETTDASGRQGLSPKEFREFTVKEVKPYNYNSNIIVFDVEDPNKPLNLPCASFILTQANIDGKDVARPYTPIDQSEPGVLNLLVKKYPTGAMSSHIHSLKQGDKLQIKGPLPKIKYEAGAYTQIGMIAGGSGMHIILIRYEL